MTVSSKDSHYREGTEWLAKVGEKDVSGREGIVSSLTGCRELAVVRFSMRKENSEEIAVVDQLE